MGWSSPPKSGQVTDSPETCAGRESETADIAPLVVQRPQKNRRRRPRRDELYDEGTGAEFATGLEPPRFEIREMPRGADLKPGSDEPSDRANAAEGFVIEPVRHPVDLEDSAARRRCGQSGASPHTPRL